MKVRATTLFALMFASLAAPALAAVPPGTNEAYVSAGAGDATHVFTTSSNHQFAPGLYGTSQTAGTAAATATLNEPNTPVPVMDALASVTLGGPGTLGGGNAIAQGFTNYSFEVGGTGDALVHITASGGVGFNSFDTGGTGSAHLIFRVREANNGPIIYDQAFFMDGSHAGCIDSADPHNYSACALGFNVDSDFLLHTGTIYDVHMDATASISAGSAFSAGTDTAFANIDPTFTVHSPYTIQLSDGFGGGYSVGGSSAPEPQTWAMMLLGFAGLGAAARARRRALA